MANLRAIRSRIKSVENTRQITKSMKMVAAAKLRKTQNAFTALRRYAELSGDMLAQASGGAVPNSDNPYLKPHPENRRVCYVLLTGNRGLCGTYNQALLRYCENLIREDSRESSLICCGRWGKDLIRAAGLSVSDTVEISDTPARDEAIALAEKLKAIEVKVTASSGADGRLYGSITSKDIVEKLQASHAITIDKRKLVMNDPIKTYGKYEIEVKLYPEVVGKIYVLVCEK